MNAIVKTTPADGRFLADELYIKGYVGDARKIRSLADQVEALTKERDEFKAAYYSAERCASDLSKGYAKLQTHITALKAARYAYASEFSPDEEGHPDVGLIHQNIRALKAAAKLAMDVCVDISGVRMNQMEYLSVLRAIAALKAAGVQ